jgi:putative transposase
MSIRSRTRLVVHAVWATKDRNGLLHEGRDPWLLSTVGRVALSHGGEVLAAGASDDHVHVVLRWEETRALSTVIGRIKGAVSHSWNRIFQDTLLVWQDGFWAESCAPDVPPSLLDYVLRQRDRHATGALDAAWEAPS